MTSSGGNLRKTAHDSMKLWEENLLIKRAWNMF